ncbi:chemotaxis protein CheW [Tateyamaria omphalii]|uniref:chemotaxis protein CheW n=1 Tax=Tateyamaria omphalii TaxID=299262 RepID=UPI001C99F570|nr:chemotaxis protein CheW [Tateyamaria omphalii]MBY5932604.1 chemotaxis protein CheW [Tateyamaria omphalii]
MSVMDAARPVELLTFKLGDQEYSLDIMSVREIRGWTRATPMPLAPSFVRGVINLRGTVLPVIDLAERLGLQKCGQNSRNVIIVVKCHGHMTGLLVDAVSDIVALQPDEMQDPPDTGTSDTPNVVKALTLIDDRMIRVLDVAQIVTHAESDAA